MTTTPDPRWVSCGAATDWATSRYRHHARDRENGWVDTLCGATGSPGAFHTNSTKPPCPTCVLLAIRGKS